MTRTERIAFIEKATNEKVDYQDVRRNIMYYYGAESGALIAKYNLRTGKLEIIK